ncbi:MAG: amidophosphoribosyltransferase [Candidatus Lindowbacteria bacterium RIFCSPLOWO2_12_FULL_62_27]|nr:MAG: amidophosphoribosyltransferase [Candidatus Lindowbacteria bacterium RIFCSPLOWO2_12_FULL_62_27]OGH62177.1 MAG: amidophosphoribosyltransferase [Candidatus Lindowbacteria bacterium RIFCSPLOWO2_02_FULL_62_12]
MMGLREKCGVFGVFGSPTAARDLYLGLYAQQHRGQESAGMVVSSGGGRYGLHRSLGLVTQAFSEDTLNRLPGAFGIGHVRYSTAGSEAEKDIQPLEVVHRDRIIAVAHNGNIINARRLKEDLELKGSVFRTTSDTEVILHRIVRAGDVAPVKKIQKGLLGVEGAYSLVFLFNDGIAAVRDPMGFRPLYLGKKGAAIYFASETCAFDILGADHVSEIAPGDGFYVSEKGVEPFRLLMPPDEKICSFEMIYFSRPDSLFKGRSIHSYRIQLGRRLHEEHPVDADIVTGIPDSSNSAALGYAMASGIPYDIVLIRSHYTGRSFIAPYQADRDLSVRKKFNTIPDTVRGKRVVVVDDSVVRGTTSKKIVHLLRERGASEIHLRIASPMVRFPCYFGIDMPDRNDFLANKFPADQLARHLGVDSIKFLSPESLREVVGERTCRACFTGNYPVDVTNDLNCITKSREEHLYVRI